METIISAIKKLGLEYSVVKSSNPGTDDDVLTVCSKFHIQFCSLSGKCVGVMEDTGDAENFIYHFEMIKPKAIISHILESRLTAN